MNFYRDKLNSLDNPRYLRIINNYMKGMSKVKAFLKEGYSESTASSDANDFFSNPIVVEEIERRKKRIMEKQELNEDWIISRLMTIADAKVGELIEFDEDSQSVRMNWKSLTPQMKAAIGGLDIEETYSGRGERAVPVTKIKVKTDDKLRALQMLGNYLDMFKTSVTVSSDQDTVNRLRAAKEALVGTHSGSVD